MALLANQVITVAGTTPTLVAAAVGGDTVTPRPNLFLWVKNGGGASVTVTVDDPNSVSPGGAKQFDPDLSVAVPAGADRLIGPLDPTRFTNPTTGVAAITYSGVTSVTVGAFYL